MFCGSEKLIRFLGDFPRRLAIRFIFLFLFSFLILFSNLDSNLC